MVFVPTRGDAPLRHGEGVPLLPEGAVPSELDASVYLDPARYELERTKVLNANWQILCRSSEIAATGDHVVWEGQGETIVVTRRRDGGVSGFHNVCMHRGARIVKESGKGARRFNCRWHNWVYDAEGHVIGVPDREDFCPAQLEGLATPPVECDEWGGWVWAVLAGPGVAPPLLRLARARTWSADLGRLPHGGHDPRRQADLGARRSTGRSSSTASTRTTTRRRCTRCPRRTRRTAGRARSRTSARTG